MRIFNLAAIMNDVCDVTAAMLVLLNKGTAAMLLSAIDPPEIDLYSYANVFFCFL